MWPSTTMQRGGWPSVYHDLVCYLVWQHYKRSFEPVLQSCPIEIWLDFKYIKSQKLGGVGLVVSLSACHTVGHGFVSQHGHTKDQSAVRQSKRPSSVWNCLWWHALERSLRINRKSRISYPDLGFGSSATWLVITFYCIYSSLRVNMTTANREYYCCMNSFNSVVHAITYHSELKVRGPFVQTLCIEKNSYMDVI